MKPYSAAAERNRQPILDVLRDELPSSGHVLEIASGTGQHVCHFARHLPNITWQPSDYQTSIVETLTSVISTTELTNIRAPITLDITQGLPALDPLDAIVCINMLQVAPWSACTALFAAAQKSLGPDGLLFIYSPFLFSARANVASNLAFDARLKERDSSLGVRLLDDVLAAASAHGLSLVKEISMPANNLSLIFRREP